VRGVSRMRPLTRDIILAIFMISVVSLGWFEHRDAAAVVGLAAVVFIIVTRILTKRKRNQ
jgi:di/tricarboxylate transporter